MTLAASSLGSGADRDLAAGAYCLNGQPAILELIRDEATGQMQRIWTDNAGNVLAPTPAQIAAATPGPCAAAERDFVEVPYCLNGSPALRRAVRDETTGAETVTWHANDGTLLAPTAAQVAAAQPGPCTTPAPADKDFEASEWCVGGSPAIRDVVIDEGTGAETVTWRRSDGTVFVPTAAQLTAATPGSCDTCCATPIAEGCWQSGANTGRWVSLLQPDGTITLSDPVTGLAVSPTDVVSCPGAAAASFDTHVEVITNANRVLGPIANLYSWSVRLRSGAATIDAGDGVVAMDVGETIASTADTGGSLLDTVTIAAPAGSIRLVWIERV